MPFWTRSECVRNPFGMRSEPVRNASGTRSESVRDAFGTRPGRVLSTLLRYLVFLWDISSKSRGVCLFQKRNAQILVNLDRFVLFWAMLGAIWFVCVLFGAIWGAVLFVCAILGHFGCNFVCVCVLFWAILGAILSVLH